MTSERQAAAPVLSVESVSVELGGFRVLNDVSFATAAGTLVGVVGPNGAGKTTLFNVISGVTPNYTGRVLLHGADADRSKGALAYVPQRERVNWRFPLNVSEVVMLGRSQRIGLFRRPGKQDRDAVEASLRRVGLWEQRSALVAELSGGQRQRVFVARALAQEAEIILLDEAFSGVDVGSQEGLVSVLQELRDDGKVVLVATHDLTNLARRFDEVLCLNHHVCAFGPPETAFTQDVLEELYGSHGVEFIGHGTANGGA
jgi:ABC-type Mn2+/Zn2+ transport system ATPase subunit